MFILFFVFVLF